MSNWNMRDVGGSGASLPSGSGQQRDFIHNLSGHEIQVIINSIHQHRNVGSQPTAASIALYTGLAENRVQAFLHENPQHLAELQTALHYSDLDQGGPLQYANDYLLGSGLSSQQASGFESRVDSLDSIPLSNYSTLEGALDLRPTAAPHQTQAGAPTGSGSSPGATGSGQGIYTSPGGTEYNTDPTESVRLKSLINEPPKYAHLSTDEDHSRLLLSGQESGFDRPGRGVRAFDHIRPEDVLATVEGMRHVYRGAMDKRTTAQRQANPQGAGLDNASRIITKNELWMQDLAADYPTITKEAGTPIDITPRGVKRRQANSIGTAKNKSKQVPNPASGEKHPNPIIKTTPEKGTLYDISPENSIELTTGKLLHLSMDENHSRILPEGAATGYYRPTTMSANAFNDIPPEDRDATLRGTRELFQRSQSKSANSRLITGNRSYLSGLGSNFPSVSEPIDAPIGPESYISKNRMKSVPSKPKDLSESNLALQSAPRTDRNSPANMISMYEAYIQEQLQSGESASTIARAINTMEGPMGGAPVTGEQVQRKMNELQLVLNRTAAPTTQQPQQHAPEQPFVEPSSRRSTSRGQEPYFAPSPWGASQPLGSPRRSRSRFNSPDPRNSAGNRVSPQGSGGAAPMTVRPSDLLLRRANINAPATARPFDPQASVTTPPTTIRPTDTRSLLSPYLHPAGMNSATTRPDPTTPTTIQPVNLQASANIAPSEALYVSEGGQAVSVYRHPSVQDQRTIQGLAGYRRGRGTDGEIYLITPQGDVHQVSNRPSGGRRNTEYRNAVAGLITAAENIGLGMNGLSGLFGMHPNWAYGFRGRDRSNPQASGNTIPGPRRPTTNISSPLRPTDSQGARNTAPVWQTFQSDPGTIVQLRVHQFDDTDDQQLMNQLGGYRRGADAGGRTYVITPEGTAHRITYGRESYTPEALAAFQGLRQASSVANIPFSTTSDLFGLNRNWLSLVTRQK